MFLEEGEILSLNDKEYIVVSIVEYNNDKYAYFVSNFKPVDILVAKVEIINDDLSIEEVEDENLLEEIMKLIVKE